MHCCSAKIGMMMTIISITINAFCDSHLLAPAHSVNSKDKLFTYFFGGKLKMKKEENKTKNGLAEYLKPLLITVRRERDDSCVPRIIAAIIDEIDRDSNTNVRGIGMESRKQLVCLIDEFFIALFPAEFHVTIWEEHNNDLSRILEYSDTVLREIAPDAWRTGFRTGNAEHDRWIILAQHNDVFWATCYNFGGFKLACTAKLETLMEDAKRNVAYYLLHAGDNKILTDLEAAASDDCFCPGTVEYFSEPISWAYFNSEGMMKRDMIDIYWRFLKYLRHCPGELSCRNQLFCRAKTRIKELCCFIEDYFTNEVNDIQSELDEVMKEKRDFDAEIGELEVFLNEMATELAQNEAREERRRNAYKPFHRRNRFRARLKEEFDMPF